jgi:hypothetical protein
MSNFFFLTPMVSGGSVRPLYGDEVRFGHTSPSGSEAEYLAYIEAQRAVVQQRNQLIITWWEQSTQP